MQRLGIAQAAKSEVTHLAAVAHSFKTVNHAVRAEHVVRRKAKTLAQASLQCNARVQLNKFDPLSPQSPESCFYCADGRRFHAAQSVGFQANLRRNHRA